MSRTKEITTAAGTLACALSIGFVMQSTETASHRYGTADEDKPVHVAPKQVQSDLTLVAEEQEAFIDVQDITLTSAMPSASVFADVLSNAAKPVSPEHQTASNFCDVVAHAKPAPAATVQLSVAAPCHTSERVTVHHNGMFFTDRTGPDGTLSMVVPALSDKAVFIFAFADGHGAIAETQLEDLPQFNRVVLQWRGTAGFELHAREFGAEYGQAGHVWRDAEGLSLTSLTDGTGGYLHSLGNLAVIEPHIAEIYTFPALMSGRNGHVDLSVEAEVTAGNCGLEVEAQTLERDGAGRLRTQNLTLAMPGCEAIGDYLVLNNILEDMKVAAR